MPTDTELRDLRESLKDAIRLQGKPYTDARRGVFEFCCPVHGDKGKNAWLRDYAWGCWVCQTEGNLKDLAGILGVDLTWQRASFGYTLEDYAEEKHLSVEDLLRWGVHVIEHKGREVVAIPHRTPDGTLVRSQVRSGGGKKWWHSDGEGVYPYGLDMLARVPTDRPVIICEGASDCHAAWTHKIPAVGLPGASTWREEWKAFFEGRPVYVWQETDEAGSKLARAICADLPDARILDPVGIAKDMADLHKGNPDQFRAIIQRLIGEATKPDTRKPSIPYDPVVGIHLADLKERKQQPVQAIPMPWPEWNKICRGQGGGIGLALGWHVLVAARSGFGKTIVASNIAHAALEAGESVAFHSLEMYYDELVTRTLAICSGEYIGELEQGEWFKPETFDRAAAHMEKMQREYGSTLYVNREPVSKLDDITTAIKYNYEVRGCRLHIVDYLQLAWTGKADTLREQITEVSHEVRRMAKELKVVTVGLSQFNRETTFSNDRPQKEGLMGGSSLENDSDQTILLDHSRKEATEEGWNGWALVDKNRHGPQPDIPVAFSKRTLRMRQRTEDEILASELEISTRKKGRNQ